MTHQRFLTLAGLLLASCVIGACSALKSWAPSFLRGEAKPVTFYLTIPPDGFSPEAELRVSLWTAEQVAASEKIANCAISQDPQTGEETVQCPEGVEYQEITPRNLYVSDRQPQRAAGNHQSKHSRGRKIPLAGFRFEPGQLQHGLNEGRRHR